MIKTDGRVKLGALKPLGPKRGLTQVSGSLASSVFFLDMFTQQSFHGPCVSGAVVGAGESKKNSFGWSTVLNSLLVRVEMFAIW